MRLHPGTSEELHKSVGVRARHRAGKTCLDVGDDGHGLDFVHVVEGLEEDVGGSAIPVAQRVGQLVQEVKGLLCKVDPDVAAIADEFEQVAKRVEAGFLVLELVDVANADQGLKVDEGDGWSR